MIGTRHDTDTVIGLTQTELAERLRVSTRTVERLRAADALPPEIRTVKIGAQRRYLLVLDGSGRATEASIPTTRPVARPFPTASIPTEGGHHE